MDVVAYLAKQGYHGRKTSGKEIQYPCFFDCQEPADSRKRKLYVNADSGLYSCKVCVCEGNHVSLMRHFGDEPERDDTSSAITTGRRSDVLETATAVAEQMLANNEDVLDYLLGPRRCLAPETILNRRLGYAPAQWPLTDNLPEAKKFTKQDKVSSGLLAVRKNDAGEETGVYEYYKDRVLIPYVVDGRVVQIRGKDIFGRYYTPIGDPVYLYNADSLKGATEAVLVEGEFDCMMLADLLATGEGRIAGMAVVGLAGTGAIPEDFMTRLAHLKRVWIATDPDDAGRKAAEKLKGLLGDRAEIMPWPADMLERWVEGGRELKDLDWTTWIGQLGVTVGEVSECLKVRGRLKTPMQALIEYRNRPTTGLKLGYRGLDAAFLPGLLPGQVMVILAKTGTGKTVILCNLCYNMRRQRVLYITLEMTAEEIWVRLARIHRFYEPYASDETIAEEYSNLRICDANRLNEYDFAKLVEEYTEDLGMPPEVVMVDYLGYYARGRQGGSAYEKTTDAVMQLKAEAKSHRLTVITPAQVNRGAQEGKPLDTDSARDSGGIEETADLLVGMWRPDDALEAQGIPTGKLAMKILKSRHGNKDRVFQMQMGLHSLVITDDTDQRADRARRESDAVFRGITYDRWLESLRSVDQEIRS